jgi:hypothetical protein
MGHRRQPSHPTPFTAGQLLNEPGLKWFSRWNHRQQWLQALPILGNSDLIGLLLPGGDQLLKNSSAESWHVHRQHQQSFSRGARQHASESLQRPLPGRWLLHNGDAGAISQLIRMGLMAADHLQWQTEKPHLIHQGSQPDPSTGVWQQSFVLTHAPALSAAEQAGTQHQQRSSPHNFIQLQSIPTPAVTTATQQEPNMHADQSDELK